MTSGINPALDQIFPMIDHLIDFSEDVCLFSKTDSEREASKCFIDSLKVTRKAFQDSLLNKSESESAAPEDSPELPIDPDNEPDGFGSF